MSIRTISPLLLVMWLAQVGWGTTYYVNHTTGANTNNGTAVGTPWKDVQFAAAKVAAGDTVNIVASATDPVRDCLVTTTAGTDGNPITYQGTSSSVKAHFLRSRDVSDGSDWGNALPNGGFEDWITTTNAFMWTETPGNGEIVQETSIVHGGASSLEIRRVTTSLSAITDIFLPGSTAMTISFWYYEDVAAKAFSVQIWDRTANVQLNDDGTWGNPRALHPNDSTDTWASYSKSFTTNSAGHYTISFYSNDNGAQFYIDDLNLTFDAACSWSVHDGSTYKLEGKVTSDAGVLLKCSDAEWSANGVTSLYYVPKAADLATCVATANTWWYASDVLYYHLAGGEAIGDVHLEMTLRQYNIAGDAQDPTISSAAAYQTFNYLAIYGASTVNVALSGANATLNHCFVRNGNSANITLSGADTVGNDLWVEWSADGDNIDIATNTVTLNRCVSSHSMDEGIEVWSSGTGVLNYCISQFDGENGDQGTEGIYCLGGSLTCNNCTVYDAAGAGIGVAAGETLTVINCASYGNGFNDVRAGAGATLTAHHNCYGTSYDQWDALGGAGTGTLTATDPLWVNPANGDFRLKATSPCIDAGTDLGDSYDDDFLGFDQDNYGSGWEMGAYAYTLGQIMWLKLED